MAVSPTGPDAHGVGAADMLPRPPGAIRRFGARHPRLVDVAIALACQLPTTLVLVVGASFNPDAQLSWAIGAVASVIAGVALLWRRRHALVVAIVCGVTLLAPMQPTLIAACAASYSAGAYDTRVRRWVAFGIVALCIVAGPAVHEPTWQDAAAASTSLGLFGVLSCLVSLTMGMSVRSRRDYIDALIARGDDMRRERDQQAALAAARERARIAREMHDVVSHGITMMVTLAEGAAAQASRDPERASTAMRTVATTGREALAEMRRLLGVLQEPAGDEARAPQPTSDDLAALMDRFRDAGMPLRWTVTGERIEQQSVALAVHRIVQEALTNVLRHAPGTRGVDAVIEHRDGVVSVTIDDAGGAGVAPSTTGAGRGLVGMRERAALHGGTVEAGPRPDGGWRVRAVLSEEAG